MTNETHRIMPIEVEGHTLMVRTKLITAAENPLTFEEKMLSAMADEIERLKEIEWMYNETLKETYDG